MIQTPGTAFFVIFLLCVSTTVFAEQKDSAEANHRLIMEQRFERRAIEAGTWVMPQVMYHQMAKGAFDSFGGDELTIFYYSQPMDWRARMVTGNNNSPYVHTYHDLSKTGPVVLEVPPATDTNSFFGTFLDSWHKPIIDVGPDGADQGKGGKYLVVPKGYRGQTTGFIVVEQETHKGYISFRSLTKTTSEADMRKHQEYVRQLKFYPLGASSTDTSFIDLYGKIYDATIKFDMRFWHAANAMIQAEEIRPDEKAFYGMMKSLGIEKGQPFDPSTTQIALLERAAEKLHEEMMDNVAYYAPELWPGKSRWTLPVPAEMMITKATFATPNWNDYQSRGAVFYFYFAPPASLAESKSTTYIKGALDSKGRKLNGKYDYAITIPADVPARRFWSMITYATKDGTYIRESDRIGIASNEQDIVKEDNGSTVLNWSRNCHGKVNCMPVTAGEDFFVLFRLYGPEQAFFDKSFVLPDIERIDR